jgi:hypothetical protein
MKPVRIISPGADVALPLRMVAAGAGASVGLTLYVIGEGRYHPQNFPDAAAIDDKQLFWNFNTSRSNYQELSQAAMASNMGRSWLTESTEKISTDDMGQLGANYQSACLQEQRGADVYGASSSGGSSSGGSSSSGNASSSSGGSDAGDTEGGIDAAAASSSGSSSSSSGASSSGGQGPRPMGAKVCDDLDVARRGMLVGGIWLTRLRANLAPSALGQDLRLEAAAKQAPVSRVHQAQDPTATPAAASVSPISASRTGSTLMFGLTTAYLALRLRRRNKRHAA